MTDTRTLIKRTEQRIRAFAVRVTTRRGDEMYLRQGSRPGCGPIVRFRSRRDAQMAIATLAPGLENGLVAHVVAYPERIDAR
jgi:hypothetical protein